MVANVNKCAIFVCNENRENPENFKYTWEEEESPTVHQHTHLGEGISKNCSWDVHMEEVIGKGKTRKDKIDVILTDSNLGSKIKVCILTYIDVSKLYTQEKYRKGTHDRCNSWKKYKCKQLREYSV